MVHQHRILVVEDSPSMQAFISGTLKRSGYSVLCTSTGLDALTLIENNPPHLIVLDLLLPGMNGFDLCHRIRGSSTVPIIVLTSLDKIADKLKAFELGADDYVVNPCSPEELVARVHALLRRSRWFERTATTHVFRCGKLEIDVRNRCLLRNDKEIQLTRTEWALLEELVQNVGKVQTHEQLLQKVWGRPYSRETEYLRVYIGRLRQKLEDNPRRPRHILTEPGIGYRLVN